MPTDPLALDDLTLRDRLARGKTRATEVAAAVSARIAARDGALRAFAWSGPDHLARQAEALESRRHARQPLVWLHGLPVSLKDIIDTVGIPTGNGSALDEGRVPANDARIVSRLKRRAR